MTDQELLQAIGQVIETKVEPVRQDIRELHNKVDRLEIIVDSLDKRVSGLERRVTGLEEKMTGVRVYIDTDLPRTLNLLLEGQQALWDRFVPQEQYNTLESRTEVLELAVKRHSQEVRELKRA